MNTYQTNSILDEKPDLWKCIATLRTANAHGTEPHPQKMKHANSIYSPAPLPPSAGGGYQSARYARKSLGAPNKVFHIKVSDDRSVNAPVDDRHRLKTEPVSRQTPQADKDNPL
jgi:hypothetical protein